MIYILIALTMIVVAFVVMEYVVIITLLEKINKISRCLEIAENDIRIMKRREQIKQIHAADDLKFGD